MENNGFVPEDAATFSTTEEPDKQILLALGGRFFLIDRPTKEKPQSETPPSSSEPRQVRVVENDQENTFPTLYATDEGIKTEQEVEAAYLASHETTEPEEHELVSFATLAS